MSMMKEIAFIGGADRFVKISTRELGVRLGISQQSSSRWLNELKSGGFLETRRSGRDMYIKLTHDGVALLKREMVSLLNVFGSPNIIRISGNVITGLGEGRYYIMKSGYLNQIVNKLGFTPYPGTLNIKVNPAHIGKLAEIRSHDGIKIHGFVEGQRKFGNVYAYFCTINGYGGAVIIPEMSHYTDVLEVIADVNLREKINLEDGSEVNLEILL